MTGVTWHFSVCQNQAPAGRKTGHSLLGCNPLISLGINGRRGGIRTRDPLHPMQVRYQAALHADKTQIIAGL